MGYGWGDDSSSPSTSSTGGHSHEEARKAYPKPVSTPKSSPSRSSSSSSRSSGFSKASTPVVSSIDSRRARASLPVGKTVKSNSTHPLVIGCDHTGSMKKWPSIFIEKSALLGDEVARIAPDHEISFFLIGDGLCDTHAFQARDFASGPPLTDHLNCLYPEGGGGDSAESYALAAYYYLHHCEINNAVKPIFVMVLDDIDHGKLYSREIKKFTGDDTTNLNSNEIFAELAKKFSVYIVLHGDHYKSHWQAIFGEQHVVTMDEPRDIVEIIIGIISCELGAAKEFETRSKSRHSDRPDRISRVSKALTSVREAAAASEGDEAVGKSVTRSSTSSRGLKSRSLDD